MKIYKLCEQTPLHSFLIFPITICRTQNSSDTPKFMRTANRQSKVLRAIILQRNEVAEHLLALPFEYESCVLAFYHKTDRNYQKLRHYFNSISRDEKLKCLNYLIFEYAENYFFSSKIHKELETNKYLKQLSREANGRPDFGLLAEENSYGIGYKPVSMDDIPVFLSKEWAI